MTMMMKSKQDAPPRGIWMMKIKRQKKKEKKCHAWHDCHFCTCIFFSLLWKRRGGKTVLNSIRCFGLMTVVGKVWIQSYLEVCFFSTQQLLSAAVKSVRCRLRSRTLFLTVRSHFFDWEQLAGKHLQSSALAVKMGAGGALDSEWPAGGVT